VAGRVQGAGVAARAAPGVEDGSAARHHRIDQPGLAEQVLALGCELAEPLGVAGRVPGIARDE
jgi:hypothetical protein